MNASTANTILTRKQKDNKAGRDEVSRLQGVHESHQVSFLFVRQRHIETLIVEVDHVQQGRSRAVMEVGARARPNRACSGL
jgi:hypothetical protein